MNSAGMKARLERLHGQASAELGRLHRGAHNFASSLFAREVEAPPFAEIESENEEDSYGAAVHGLDASADSGIDQLGDDACGLDPDRDVGRPDADGPCRIS